MDQKQFGKFMAKERQKSGKTQGEISRALGYTSPQFLSNFERGLCVFPLPKLKELCGHINTPPLKIYGILLAMEQKRLKKGLSL